MAIDTSVELATHTPLRARADEYRLAAVEAASRLRARLSGNVAAARSMAARRLGRQSPVRASWRRWLVVGIGLAAPIAAAIDPVFGAHGVERSWATVQAAVAVTHLGSSGWMYVVLAAILGYTFLGDWQNLAFRARARLHHQAVAALYGLVSIGLCEIVVTVLKQAVGRARPRLFETLGPYHLDSWTFASAFTSFPSGHAATAACAATCVALLFPRVRLVALLLALWIAATRMVGGAHYPSDVVAGLMIGSWIAYAVALRFAAAGFLFEARPGRLPSPRAGFHIVDIGLHRWLARWLETVDRRLGPAVSGPERSSGAAALR